ncbi:putative lipoprotein/thioredoxin [Flavobacterium limnosediminis JC2902]|uniref:Putative lipoprotein/thioredoxin n=1 Tax=Flavobacterium limnosediminis JC2902 TaxID=1341181 RepID=V6SVM0_9FLAO|nr:TlpA disulfide reductase family protein [Flavobacterium limnosediminis]ESU28485.1 putative lipoprotein/thioredoxin [Flavobacterium limnosediminis JC2902]
MTKKLLLLAGLSILASCNKIGDNEYLITGKAEGIENGKMAILQVQNEMGPVSKDTVKIENGKFEFKGEFTEGPEIGFIMVESINNGMVPFILENGEINITVDKDTIQKSKISGTNNNDKFQEYNDGSSVIYKKMIAFQKSNQQKFIDARKANDTAVMNSLTKQNMVFQKDMDKFSETFAEKNPTIFLSSLLLENFIGRQTLEADKIVKLYNALSSDIKKTKSGIRVSEFVNSQKAVNTGNTAPNFSAPNPEGKMVSLKESLGKVTIIDFWASWCGPCRAENPNVVALYNEFHAKGLNIIGVSLDKDADKWKDAIAKDKLAWTQVSNLKFWEDPIAKQYNVKSIPATFILDASGKIVGKDLKGAELKAKIAELLAK